MAAGEPLLNECSPHAQQRNLLKDYFDEKELKFRHVSAEQFADVWLRYDRDGNGFIEGDEMHLFFSELLDAIVPEDLKQHMLNEEIDQLIAELRESLDKNDDDRIDISELAQLLPTEEEFIFLFFREQFVQSSDFLKELFKHSPKGNLISEDKLIEYTDNIDYDDEDLRCIKDAILTDWDADKDGKIYIDELKMMLRVQRQMSEK
ncbi:Calbindin-32 [Echinococcus granulosus]|uniref:Calbindin-32 n=1 Tax=Echinococcus granulosus TaxID=6210 RepID=W6U7T0_ECHGR|nr:Calbindin-32 [Echinococcus granulosus]EUB56416.1 Calbindin-32 [Echinococcus granulosus]